MPCRMSSPPPHKELPLWVISASQNQSRLSKFQIVNKRPSPLLLFTSTYNPRWPPSQHPQTTPPRPRLSCTPRSTRELADQTPRWPLHKLIPSLTASASAPLNLEEHRERFQERALREVTVNSNDRAMLLDPSNPTLVGEEMEAQKVCLAGIAKA